jgi:hypothetical protein
LQSAKRKRIDESDKENFNEAGGSRDSEYGQKKRRRTLDKFRKEVLDLLGEQARQSAAHEKKIEAMVSKMLEEISKLSSSA